MSVYYPRQGRRILDVWDVRAAAAHRLSTPFPFPHAMATVPAQVGAGPGERVIDALRKAASGRFGRFKTRQGHYHPRMARPNAINTPSALNIAPVT
jgi:hypothetical protein